MPAHVHEYPEMIRDIMNPMFIVDGKPRQSMKKMAMGPVKKGWHHEDRQGRHERNQSAMIENVCDITVNVDEKLSIDKFNVDEENAHIVLKENPSDEEFRKLVLCCPAALYKVEDDGSKRFDYAGCLECGTCRMICGETILEKWEYPQPTMGIEYRFG